MCDFRAIEENLRAALSVFSRARPDGEVRPSSGVLLVCAAVRFSTFNAALLTSPVADEDDLRTRLETAGQYFRRRELPWSAWLCEEWMDRRLRRKARRVIEDLDLHLLLEMPGMLAQELARPQRSLPVLEFRQVRDAATRAAFAEIMAVSFGVPPSIARQIYEAEVTWEDGLTGWVGYWEGRPVTSAATRLAGGVVGLYAVGTLPAFQRQGCAEAIVRHALEQERARSGVQASVLEATPAGRKLYERLGYRVIAHYAVYASNR